MGARTVQFKKKKRQFNMKSPRTNYPVYSFFEAL